MLSIFDATSLNAALALPLDPGTAEFLDEVSTGQYG